MNKKFITSRPDYSWASFAAHDSGAVFVELALILPILFLFVVYATDYTLEKLAEGKAQAALIAAAEFAQVKGFCEKGIQDAALNAIGANNSWPLTIESANIVVSTPKIPQPLCFGVHMADEESYLEECTAVSPATGTPPSFATGCSGGCLTQNDTGAPYVGIKVTGQYHPLFPTWWSGLQSGSVIISNDAAVQTAQFAQCIQ